MEYIRYCIKCGKEKKYKNLDSFRANKDSLLCRTCASTEKFNKLYPNKLEKLLDETPETYYWIGYLLADGHIDKNVRIKFTQNNEDKISVEKFAEYIESSCDVKYSNKKGYDCAEFSVMNHTLIPQITEKFDIKSNKTYCPPKTEIFEKMDNELLAYLFIGFVDGDGHIANLHNRKDFNLRIKIHSSWIDILKIFEERLFNLSGYAKINKQGYAELVISNTQILKQFKQKYLTNINFEPLHRKWKIIDLNFIGKYEYAQKSFLQVKELYEQGYSVNEICKKLNFKEGIV